MSLIDLHKRLKAAGLPVVGLSGPTREDPKARLFKTLDNVSVRVLWETTPTDSLLQTCASLIQAFAMVSKPIDPVEVAKSLEQLEPDAKQKLIEQMLLDYLIDRPQMLEKL
jgi:hypothetical protein